MRKMRKFKKVVALILAAVMIATTAFCYLDLPGSKAEAQGEVFLAVGEDGLWHACDGYGTWFFDYNGPAVCDYGWFYCTNGTIDWSYTGLGLTPYGWFLFINGIINTDYNGFFFWGGEWWYLNQGAINFYYNGLGFDPNYGWFYFKDGRIDWTYTGPCANEYGWFYVENGMITWNYTGLGLTEAGWFMFVNSVLDWNYTGMVANDYGWWYVYNGAINFYFNGIAQNEWGKWYFTNGALDFGYTGMYKDVNYGWKYINGGQVLEDFTGIAYNDNKAWYFKDGELVRNYTGMGCDINGKWFYMKNGDIDGDYTGMAKNDAGWWYYKDGTIDFGYTGVGRNQYGTWYFKNGQIDTSYNGTYTDGVVTYQVKNGRATAQSARSLMLGVFFNSREDASDTLYVSFDGFTFNSIGMAFEDAQKTEDEGNKATCSPSLVMSQTDPYYPYYGDWDVYVQRDPDIFYKDGYFWMLGGTRGTVNKKKYIPLLAYSKDLKNWSYPSAGIGATKDWRLEANWLLPTQDPPAVNSEGGYDAVAGDAFVDDDGTVWIVVSTGVYADNHDNHLSEYLIRVDDLRVPGTNPDITSIHGKCDNSDFHVEYGSMIPINLPIAKANANKTWSHDDYDYDGSMFKKDGKYYFVVQHSGEWVQLWRIDSLSQVSDPNAWTLVNGEMIDGSEGPTMTEFNGKSFLYVDRYPNWEFFDDDIWGAPSETSYGITASVADSIANNGHTYPLSARLTFQDKNGNRIPARHGTIITLTDQAAIDAALAAYNAAGY